MQFIAVQFTRLKNRNCNDLQVLENSVASKHFYKIIVNHLKLAENFAGTMAKYQTHKGLAYEAIPCGNQYANLISSDKNDFIFLPSTPDESINAAKMPIFRFCFQKNKTKQN